MLTEEGTVSSRSRRWKISDAHPLVLRAGDDPLGIAEVVEASDHRGMRRRDAVGRDFAFGARTSPEVEGLVLAGRDEAKARGLVAGNNG